MCNSNFRRAACFVVLLLVTRCASADSITLNPSVDGQIDPVDTTTVVGQSGDVYNTNTANDIKDFSGTSFSIGTSNALTAIGTFRDLRAFLQFDLTTVPGLIGSTINSATLELYLQPATGTNNGNVDVRQITSGSWTAATATYALGSNANSTLINNTAIAPATNPATNQYYSLVMTSTVQGWANGSLNNFGLALRETEGFNQTNRTFTSSEGNALQLPELVINFTPAVVPEPSSFVLAGVGLVGMVAWRLRRSRRNGR